MAVASLPPPGSSFNEKMLPVQVGRHPVQTENDAQVRLHRH